MALIRTCHAILDERRYDFLDTGRPKAAVEHDPTRVDGTPLIKLAPGVNHAARTLAFRDPAYRRVRTPFSIRVPY